ncbi:thioredoxin reductase-like isoform X1 [Apium graveolens]|uniref:thioredoxin reductase-like isoform X1 n=1 Tax=Apium graveolens TaxID=4045 RepID=UPI003D7B50E1
MLNDWSKIFVVTTPGTTETSLKGVLAVGDVQDKKYRQAFTVVGSEKFSESTLRKTKMTGRAIDCRKFGQRCGGDLLYSKDSRPGLFYLWR